MKMNVNRLFDHDEGHYTSFVKMSSYHKSKNENWDAFYISFHVKLAKKYHLTPARAANLWDRYTDDRHYACLESDMRMDEYMSFDKWLEWRHLK